MELAEPKVVVGHLGNEVRLIDERDAARLEIAIRPFDIADEEVEDRPGMVVLLLLRGREHEPRATGIEKGQRRAGGEQKGDAKGIAIECGGARYILANDGDLADAGLTKIRHGRVLLAVG